jgi:hypothetical protein
VKGRLTATAVVLGIGFPVGGCGAAGTAHVSRSVRRTSTDTRYLTTLTHRAPPRLSHDALAPVGATQHVSSARAGLSVRLRAVIDPLTGSGAKLPAGTRAVAVLVQIRNSGPAVYDSSATGDFTVIPSGGAVTPVLATRGICKTPVEDFDRYLTAGEDRVGCVVFAIPIGATVTGVRFSPHAEAKGRLVWAG